MSIGWKSCTIATLSMMDMAMVYGGDSGGGGGGGGGGNVSGGSEQW